MGKQPYDKAQHNLLARRLGEMLHETLSKLPGLERCDSIWRDIQGNLYLIGYHENAYYDRIHTPKVWEAIRTRRKDLFLVRGFLQGDRVYVYFASMVPLLLFQATLMGTSGFNWVRNGDLAYIKEIRERIPDWNLKFWFAIEDWSRAVTVETLILEISRLSPEEREQVLAELQNSIKQKHDKDPEEDKAKEK